MRLIPFLLILAACSSGPVFQDTGDHEEGHDIPCAGSPGWHACHRAKHMCCPDGTSCGDDDFVPRAGVCRSW